MRPENLLLAGGKYRVVEPIGAGGFGSVWKALQYVEGTCLGPVAVKCALRPDEHKEIDSFLNEAAALRKVAHPNIVKLRATAQRPEGLVARIGRMLGSGVDSAPPHSSRQGGLLRRLMRSVRR